MIILWSVDYMFVAVQYLIIISQVVLTTVKINLLPISILLKSIKIEEKKLIISLSDWTICCIYQFIINKTSQLPLPPSVRTFS